MRRTSGDGSFLRSLNEVAVLRVLRASGSPTLAELARALVVIGGSLARTGERLTEPIRALLGEVCLYPPEVRVSELGGDAVGTGAVRLALDHAEPLLFASLSSASVAA